MKHLSQLVSSIIMCLFASSVGLSAETLKDWALYPGTIDQIDPQSAIELSLPIEDDYNLQESLKLAVYLSPKLSLEASDESYAFYLAKYNGAIKVSILDASTGQIIATKKSGKIARSIELEQALGVPIYLEFPIKKPSVIQIRIEHSNFTHHRAGLWVAPQIASSSELLRPIIANSLLDFVSFGILIAAFTYNFMLWYRRREDKAALVLAITALLTALRVTSTSTLASWLISESWVFHQIKRMEYLTVPLLVSFGYYSTLAFDSSVFFRKIINIIGVSVVPNVIFIIFAPIFMFEKFVWISQIQVLSAVIISLIIAWRSFLSKKLGATTNLFGCIVIIVAAIWDVTVAQGINASHIFLIPVSGAIYATLQSQILGKLNANVYKRIGTLAQENAEQQAKLRLESENKLQLASTVAHYINNPLNYIETSKESFLQNSKEIEEAVHGLLGDFQEGEEEELTRCRQLFQKLFEKTRQPLVNLTQGVQSISSIVNEIRIVSGIDGGYVQDFDFSQIILLAIGSLSTEMSSNEFSRIEYENRIPLNTTGNPYLVKHALAVLFKALLQASSSSLLIEITGDYNLVTCRLKAEFRMDEMQRLAVSEKLKLIEKTSQASLKWELSGKVSTLYYQPNKNQIDLAV